jgi:hypothetical protein
MENLLSIFRIERRTILHHEGREGHEDGNIFARGETKYSRSAEIPLFVRDDNLGLTVISSGARNLSL